MGYRSSNMNIMHKIISKSLLTFSTAVIFVGCAALRTAKTPVTPVIKANIDLVDIQDDKVQISITPPAITTPSTVFYIPQIVPGTYEYSNFGRFAENVQAFDKKGKSLPIQALDENSWEILDATKLARLTYWVNDTFDGPNGQDIYPMGGTNFEEGKTFLLNLHSMIGYFEGMIEKPYKLSIRSPRDLEAFTSLPSFSKSDSLDVFDAQRYFHIIDNPILYAVPNAVSFDLDQIKVGLAIYSPSGTHKASAYQPAIEDMMKAQKAFLGDANDTASYDILLHLMNMENLQYFGGMMGALEHHTSTTVVFVDDMAAGELKQSLVDVVSHEFFHTLTPLNVHSEEIHNFEYNTPVMSKHLWMYEGTTEYFANLFQINQGLIDAPDFYSRLMEKVNYAKRYDDTMSFTEMSSGIVEEPYQSNYANVYQKGALINMCLDIIIREQSGGDHGILWVMKNLAKKYGKENPFKDDMLFDEIISMTYPEVGTFIENHIVGGTPIDYNSYFAKVGITFGDTQSVLPSILFQDIDVPFFVPQPNADGIIQYAVSGLNSSIEAMGAQVGDILLGLDGKMLPEIKRENAEEINAVFNPSFLWDAEKEITMTVERGGEQIVLTGKVGEPSAKVNGLIDDPNADGAQVALRKSWLFE